MSVCIDATVKIAFLIDSVSRRSGGLYDANRHVAQQLVAIGEQLQIFGVRDPDTETDRQGWGGVCVHTAPGVGPKRLAYSPGLACLIDAFSPDVLHRHGLWTYASHVSSRWHRRSGKPVIIHPHGMLDPWAVRHASLKKRVAGCAFEYRHLREARCIRALCESEARAIRKFGLDNPVAVIPNGIDLPQAGQQTPLGASAAGDVELSERLRGDGRKILLYLGRIHPKKGLQNLITAWSRSGVDADDAASGARSAQLSWRLVIAGWDELGHEAELKRLASALGLPWVDLRNDPSVAQINAAELVFTGPQFGASKATLYQICDAFILPSYSEGLPMAVLEAWAYGKPVLMTPECNLPEGFALDAAIKLSTSPDAISESIRLMMSMDSRRLTAMGACGRQLVADRFTWPKVSSMIRGLSLWAVNGGSPPDFVWMD